MSCASTGQESLVFVSPAELRIPTYILVGQCLASRPFDFLGARGEFARSAPLLLVFRGFPPAARIGDYRLAAPSNVTLLFSLFQPVEDRHDPKLQFSDTEVRTS